MPDDVKLLKICDAAQAAAGGTVIIACEQALKAAHGTVDIEKAVGVTCLGRVEESLLFQLIQQGVRVVTLVQGTCDSCILAHGLQTASLVAATTNELCMAWNQDARVEISSSFPAEALSGESAIYDSSRRRLFSSIKSEIQSKAARVAGTSVEKTAESSDLPVSSGKSSLPKVTADGTLPHFVPERRQNLLNALNQSGAPEDVLIATRLWGHVIINGDVCESCRMCATFCPTGALAKFDSEDGLFGLLHAPSLCVKCRACQDVCRVHALCLSDEVFAVDLSKGFVERYEMTTPLVEKRSAHSAMNAMRTIIGNDRIYEH
jgi:ferredoxin